MDSSAPGIAGTRYHPFTGKDVPWLLDQQAARYADKPLLIWEPIDGEGRTYSYQEFAEETRAVAAGLAAHGIGPGDAIIIHMDNHPALLVAWFAAARLGALAVTTNTRSTVDELNFFVDHSRARAVVTEAKYADLVKASAPDVAWISCVDGPAAIGLMPFQALRGDPQACPARAADPDLACNVIYTSGTTARPKGVVWTHANALWGAKVNAAHFRLGPDDRVLLFLPLFHTIALAWNLLGTLWSGGSAVLCPKFSTRRFWPLAVGHRCTWTNMVHFTINALGSQPDPDRHDFRFWVYGGDMAFVQARWAIRTLGAFGMTELISHPISSDPQMPGPQGAMGLPNAEYQVSLRRDDGSEADIGEIANLWVRGVRGLSVFHSYLYNPDATRAQFDAEGWFSTGDQVIARPDGQIFFAGRARDMLKVGGENVAAVEIESVIAKVPGVREVAVVGRPDRMLDEVPVAFVVAQTPSDDLKNRILQTCQSALSDFKRPRDVHFIAELPRGLMDKILKRELRNLALNMEPSSA